MAFDQPVLPSRVHLARLMKIWRSAGWPSRDPIEIDLLAAQWVALCVAPGGHETLRITDTGIQLLAQARRRNQRAASPHDRLAQRMAGLLMNAGRIVWRELSLRSRVNAVGLPLPAAESSPTTQAVTDALWLPVDAHDSAMPGRDSTVKAVWRIARPDVFSVRNTTVEDYLQPAVHEIKVSRADLLSDLRHAAKRESYQWLCSECYFVFPAGIAEPDEIPEAFGVWVLHGAVDDGRLELLRPARHSHCKLPFSVWLALAKSTPERSDDDGAQGHLGVKIDGPPTGQ